MQSILNIKDTPKALVVRADNLVEFHAARLLLLFKICGRDGKIEGLTKMAKLDFFVRYPQFFATVCEVLNKKVDIYYDGIESNMIRYHYGPWDTRYYHVLAYLESRELLKVYKSGNTFIFSLTTKGDDVASKLSLDRSFFRLIIQMEQVKEVLGSKTGTALKKLIYQVFTEEVTNKSLGDVLSYDN